MSGPYLACNGYLVACHFDVVALRPYYVEAMLVNGRERSPVYVLVRIGGLACVRVRAMLPHELVPARVERILFAFLVGVLVLLVYEHGVCLHADRGLISSLPAPAAGPQTKP